MKIRRVFFIHHILAGEGKGVRKYSQDFPESKTIDECRDEIFTKYGRHHGEGSREQREDFAEVTHSTITEDKRQPAEKFEAPKHFGTDLLLNPVEYANMEDPTKANRKKKKIV